MKSIFKKTGFTLIELVIVISILVILTAVSIVSYESTLLDARNSTRITDMGNLKISFKNHKLKNGSYPKPGSSFDVTNSGMVIIKQGSLDEDVITQEIINKPKDPLLKNYYTYAVTGNKLKFQVAMSIEDESLESDMRSYVDGDYQRVAEFVPSIVFASSTGGELTTLSGSFLLDKATQNLAYGIDGNIVKTGLSFSGIVNEAGVSIPSFYGYYSCPELYENGAYMGTGSYKMLDGNGDVVSKTCNESTIMGGPAPYEVGNSYVKGQSFTFDGLSWYVSANTKVAYTKDSGGNDVPNNLTDTDNILVFDNGQSLIKGTNAFILRAVNQGATQVYNYGTAYSSGRLWNEGATTNYGATTTLRQTAYTLDKSILGDYYQWGRNDPVSLTGTTTSLYTGGGYQTGGINYATDNGFVVNSTLPYVWISTGSHLSSSGIIWTDTQNGNNGPCPVGYHIPSLTSSTIGEWPKVTAIITGISGPLSKDYTPIIQKYLLLPMSGYRQTDGQYNEQGKTGYYWTSSVYSDKNYTSYFFFDNTNSIYQWILNYRVRGFSLRCFKN